MSKVYTRLTDHGNAVQYRNEPTLGEGRLATESSVFPGLFGIENNADRSVRGRCLDEASAVLWVATGVLPEDDA